MTIGREPGPAVFRGLSGYLLDVNVLIALIDPTHVHHDRAHSWFAQAGQHDWLSCPTTHNGVTRIVSNPRYSNAQPTPEPPSSACAA